MWALSLTLLSLSSEEGIQVAVRIRLIDTCKVLKILGGSYEIASIQLLTYQRST